MIDKIIDYFVEQKIIDKKNRIKIDFLGKEPTEFSIEKIPINPIIDKFIDGSSYRQLQFQLISRKSYSSEYAQNMQNNDFYENFYEKIEELNNNKILPKINGIETIECLDNGAIQGVETNTARYSILMRITYFETN